VGTDLAESMAVGLGMDAITRLRQRSARNLFATLLFSAGVPMFAAGDESGRTQQGNNNAYCQDNPISWLDWEKASWKVDLRQTVKFLLALRRRHPTLRPRRFFTGTPLSDGVPDLSWYTLAGQVASGADWDNPGFRAVQMLRHSDNPSVRDALMVINGNLEMADAALPAGKAGQRWELVWDSTWDHPDDADFTDGLEGPRLVTPLVEEVPLHVLSTRLYLSAP
jgi:glycogen operon protein